MPNAAMMTKKRAQRFILEPQSRNCVSCYKRAGSVLRSAESWGTQGGVRPSRLLAITIAGVFLAACASEAKLDQVTPNRYGDAGGTTTTSPSLAGSSETTTNPAGGTTTKPRGGTATTDATTRPGSGGGGGTNTGGGGATSTTGLKPLPTTVRGDDGAQGPPGAFARTLLRPQRATTIVFERLEQQGASPRQASLAHATAVLGDVSGKPVTTEGPIAVPGGAKNWTADELRKAADTLTTAGQGNGRAVLHAFFLHGTFEGNEEILGVTVRGDVFAVFVDRIAQTAAPPFVTHAQLEDAVLMHELGHALGLVDLARDTDRDDPESPGHSPNKESVMYWAVESSLVRQVLTGPPPRDFDGADLADLRALRNGA